MTAALIKRILYLIATVSTVAIVFLVYYLPQDVWLLAPAFLLLNISLDTSLLRRTMIVAVAGVISVAMVFVGTLMSPFVVVQLIVLALLSGYCVYISVVRGKQAYPWLVVNLLGVLSIHTDGTFASALGHAQATFYSLIILLLAQIVLLPFYARDEYRSARIESYEQLRRLMADIFNCLLSPEYTDNIYLFERRIHKAKIKALKEMAILAQREAAFPHVSYHAQEVQTLFQLIVDAGQIRRRVTDHTVFALCRDELKDTVLAISRLLNALGSGDEPKELTSHLETLESAIQNFDNSFETVLRVTAREPLVFVLMMNALQSFEGQCRRIIGMVSQQMEAA